MDGFFVPVATHVLSLEKSVLHIKVYVRQRYCTGSGYPYPFLYRTTLTIALTPYLALLAALRDPTLGSARIYSGVWLKSGVG